MKMDGNFITEQNYKKLYGSSAMELTVGYYDVEKNAIVAYDKPRQIASARPVNDNPVHYKNVYTSGSKKIGYLSTTTSVPAPRTTVMNMTTTCAAHSNISHHSKSTNSSLTCATTTVDY